VTVLLAIMALAFASAITAGAAAAEIAHQFVEDRKLIERRLKGQLRK